MLGLTVTMSWACGDTFVSSDIHDERDDPRHDRTGEQTVDAQRGQNSGETGLGPECTTRPDGTPPRPDPNETYQGPFLLTINELPASMNGSKAVFAQGGDSTRIIHRVNRQNFTLDLFAPGQPQATDWGRIDMRCDHPFRTPQGGEVPAGEAWDVTSLEVVEPMRHRRLRVDLSNALPEGLIVRCEAMIQGDEGTLSSEVIFETASMPTHLDPFVTPDLWLVTTSRDIWRLDVSPQSDGSYALMSTHVPTGNGIADFDEAFLAMGLFSQTNTVANARLRQWLLEEIKHWVYAIMGLDERGHMTADGVPLSMVFEGDEGAPLASSWDGTFSMIALGGDGEVEDQLNGTVGRALIDYNNQGHEDNTAVGLGVFTSGVVRQILGQPFGVLLLEPILPDLGLPVGDHPDDLRLISEGFVPTDCEDDALLERYTLIELAVSYGALALASTLAHEIGHSLGLVPPGLPPEGLFGGVSGLAFTEHDLDDAHIDSAGLNVMQTGAVTNWLEALSDSPRFNPTNWAYLRRQLIVGEPSPVRP